MVADWIKQGFDKIAEEGTTGLGTVPLDRLLSGHLDFLGSVRATGATWVQIASALSVRGVAQKSGRPLSGDQVRGVYSRLQRRAAEAPGVQVSTDTDGRQAPVRSPEAQVRTLPAKPGATGGGAGRLNSIKEKLARVAKLRDGDSST